MPRLTHMVACSIAKSILASLLLMAVCAPYVHAAVEMGEHEECSMEMCKRAGKCCCRRTNPGKPHWTAQDLCHRGLAQLPGVFTGSAAELPESRVPAHLVPTATDPVPPSEVLLPAALQAIVRYQLPPPKSL